MQHVKPIAEKLSFFTDREKVINFYNEYGYHIEHDVYSDAECHEIIEAARNLAPAQEGIFKPAMMPHRTDNTFLSALKNQKIAIIMSELIGGTPVGLQSEFFYCKPGTRGFSLHQDNFYVEADYGVFASAWSPLTDIYPEKGGLIIYPRTHKAGSLPVRKLQLAADTGQDPNANNEETIVPDEYEVMHVEMPKGASLFIHGHLVHGSNPNQTDKWRYVLLNTYLKKGARFRPGNHAKREEVSLDI